MPQVEWVYVKPSAPAPGETPNAKWWRKVPAIKAEGGLTERWSKELAAMVTWCSTKLAVCRQVNDKCIQAHPHPLAYTSICACTPYGMRLSAHAGE